MQSRSSYSQFAVFIMGLVCLGMIGWTTPSWSHPDLVDPEMAAAQSSIAKAFPGIPTGNWQVTPVAGLYMFTMSDDHRVYYVDRTGKYLLAQAALFDMVEKKNLTLEFIKEQRRDLASRISLDRAIVYGPSDPSVRSPERTIYVFDDPDCPYCREFHKEIPALVAGDGCGVATSY
jgi:thiol:disulfide interchange protein DsbC